MNNSIITKQAPSENPAKNNMQEFEQNSELNRIKTKNEKLSFRLRLKSLKQFARIAVFLLLFWSATTESLFLYSGFYEITSSICTTVLGVLLIVVLLEGGKYFFGTFAILFLTQGWIKDGALYILTYIVLLPTTIGLFYGSYYMSVMGAPKIAQFVKSQTSTPQLINTDSINKIYDARIVLLQGKIDSTQNIKWKGVTTKTATKLAIAFQDQIIQLENQRKNSLKIAQKTNEKQAKNEISSTALWGRWLSRFGGTSEFLTIVFLLFLELYDRASYLELPTVNSVKTAVNKPVNNDTSTETGLVQQAVDDATTEDADLQKIKDLIRTKKVDARYMKQRAKQCYKRSFKDQSLEEVRQKNRKRADLFITELASIGIETIINPNDNADLIFVEKQ